MIECIGTEWQWFRIADGSADEPKMRMALRIALANSLVPDGLWDGLIEYVLHGRWTGSFLEAVLCNDLRKACEKADLENRYHLYDLIFFLYNYSPGECWGDEKRVTSWKTDKGYIGKYCGQKL